MKLLNLLKVVLLVVVLVPAVSCQRRFEKEIKKRLDRFEKVGLQNYKLERTSKEAIRAFFASPPPYPYYRNLLSLRSKFTKYNDNAKAFSQNDKVRHCYIGHVVARKHAYKTAVFIAFYKEAQDVGDGKRRTRFEIADQEATVYGAQLAMEGVDIEQCHEAEELFQ